MKGATLCKSGQTNFSLLGGGLLLLLLAAAVQAQQVAFLSPSDEAPVKELVLVQTDLGAENEEGYVMYYIGRGEDLEFKIATVYPFIYEWDTRDLKDGEYKILAIGHNSNGEAIGQAELNVQVQNHLPPTDLPPEGILFRYDLEKGLIHQYKGHSRANVKPGENAQGLGDLSFLRGGMGAWWKQQVLFYTEGGYATVRHRILNGYLDRGPEGSNRRPFPLAGKFFTVLMRDNGEIKRRRKGGENFGYGQLELIFPDRPVRVGESWDSEMKVLAEIEKREVLTVDGHHTFEGVEWLQGYKCARIKSEYTGTTELTLNLGGRQIPLKAETRGTRTTYFAYELGKVIKVEEETTHNVTVQLAQQQAGVPGMMGGYGGLPGMGGMEFGAMPGAPGEMPYPGMPGMMGEGMGEEMEETPGMEMEMMQEMMGPYGSMPGSAPLPGGVPMPGAMGGGMVPYSMPGGGAGAQAEAGAPMPYMGMPPYGMMPGAQAAEAVGAETGMPFPGAQMGPMMPGAGYPLAGFGGGGLAPQPMTGVPGGYGPQQQPQQQQQPPKEAKFTYTVTTTVEVDEGEEAGPPE
ncbi:MAG TPA: hypothetical protein EYP85_05640 [Armatimonadetes bacterium]|nr:hypothetical protein [Armatimonadota bacterium]